MRFCDPTLFKGGSLRLLALLACPFVVLAQGSGIGVISGTISEELRKGALRSAEVGVEGTALVTLSDANGRYELRNVPAGPAKLIVTMLGYADDSREITVEANRVATADFELKINRTSVTVVGEPIFEGQAKALNEQLNAVNIKNVVSADQIGRFPDPNAAEATQRVPGVTILRDQGEGRYVIVRGTEPRLNATLINGERLPAPEGDLRQVALDVVPADLLETIEVTKALTADMDADSIGGSVNLITKAAPIQPRLSLTLGGGVNSLTSGPIKMFNGTYGRRAFRNRFGYVVSGNFFETDRGSQNFESAWDGRNLAEFELRDYTLRRTRQGITGNFDYRLGEGSSLFFRTIYNDYQDNENRRVITSLIEDGEMERGFRERFEAQKIQSYMAGGNHLLGNSWRLDYRFTYAYAEENEPRALNTTFKQEDVVFRPVSSGSSIGANPQNENLARYLLDDISSGVNFTSDRDFVGSFNVSRPFRFTGSNGALLKFGGRFRDKRKLRNNRLTDYSPDDDVPLSSVQDPGFSRPDFLDGRYAFRPGFPAPGWSEQQIRSGKLEEEIDPEENVANYDANEKVQAGYVMSEFYLGEKLMLLPGFRFERTGIDYQAPRITFDEDGDFAGQTLLNGSNAYTNWLPSFHARYRLRPNTNIRAAFTRSLARPNYSDLPPFELVLREDREISRGNPNLKTTTSNNFDLLGEHYFSTVGVVSGGFFYKRLANNIFLQRAVQNIGGERYDVFQPQNGESANLYGVEIAYQNRLSFLPGPWSGLGFYGNFTGTRSDSRLLDRSGVALPGQAGQTANLSLSYERRGFSGRVSWNYQGKLLEEVGDDADSDAFLDRRHQLDLSVSQRLSKNLRLFFDVLNLTNRPFRRFEGTSDRPLQEEYYKSWLMGGIKIDF
jgi:TonB-dependent receptor